MVEESSEQKLDRMKPRMRAIVGIESTDDMKLSVKLIHLVEGDEKLDDFVFEWFAQHGNTIEEARENCVGSLVAYLQCCKPGLRGSILNALEPEAARDVRDRLGIPREEKEETRSRR